MCARRSCLVLDADVGECQGCTMTEEMAHLVLGHLRQIDAKIDSLDEALGHVEGRHSTIERDLARLLSCHASQSAELNKIGQRLDRVERRLELTDG